MPHSQLSRQNVAGIHYTRTLAAAYRRFLWLSDPDFAHQADVEAWEKVRRDPVILHAMNRRRHAAAGTDWQLVPATDDPRDQRTAALMTDLVRQIRSFHPALFNLAEGIFRGSSWAFTEGRRRSFSVSDDERRTWWVPERLRHVDRWRFRVARVDPSRFGVVDEDIRTAWEFFSVSKQDWKPLKSTRGFVQVVYEDLEETLGYGRGLLQAIFFFWRAKEVALAHGLMGLERWALGLVQVGIDGLRVGSDERSNDQIANDWIDELDKHRSEHVLVCDKIDELKVHWPSGSGHQIVMEMLQYFDQAITQLILMSVLPTGGGQETGSFARAKVEQETAEAVFATDRQLLSEAIQDSLIDMVWRLNLGTIRRLLAQEGLAGEPRCPEFKIGAERPVDPKDAIAVLTQAVAVAPIRSDEFYERIGHTKPEKGDDVIGPISQEPAEPAGLEGGGLEGLFSAAAKRRNGNRIGRYHYRKGEPCASGETSAKTECVPSEGESKTQVATVERVVEVVEASDAPQWLEDAVFDAESLDEVLETLNKIHPQKMESLDRDERLLWNEVLDVAGDRETLRFMDSDFESVQEGTTAAKGLGRWTRDEVEVNDQVLSGKMSEDVSDLVELLDRLRERGGEEQIVYRGGKVGNVSVGETFRMKGLVSATEDPAIAHRFGKGENVLRIRTPAGIKVGSESPTPEEHEVLLGHNWTYRVTGRSRARIGSSEVDVVDLMVV